MEENCTGIRLGILIVLKLIATWLVGVFFICLLVNFLLTVPAVAFGAPYFYSAIDSPSKYSEKGYMRFEVSPGGYISYFKYELHKDWGYYQDPFTHEYQKRENNGWLWATLFPTAYLGLLLGGCLATLVPQPLALAICLAIVFVAFCSGMSGAGVYYVIVGGKTVAVCAVGAGGTLAVLGIVVVLL